MAIDRDKVLQAAQKYVEKKKYDKAVLEYRKLIDADPNDARTLLKIGDLQAKQGLHADAISTYESVGRLYAQQGFALKAIAVYKQIREIIAKHVPQLEERYGHIAPKLAELYQQLGLTSDALAALDEVATRLQRQQRDQEAIEVFQKIVELDPTNPLPHLRLAEAFSRVKDVEGAVFEFKTAASQLAGIGRRDDALKVLERLLHHKPDAEQARICAELYLSRAQPQDGMQALAKLQICFQANPRDFDTLALLARAFNAIGQGAKAIEVQKEMARVARDSGKQDLFREIVERLLRVAPNDEGVRKLAGQLSGQLGATGAAIAAPAPAAPDYPQASGLQRPATQNMYAAPPPAPPPRMPTASAPDLEQVEELGYEEVDAEEVIEEVSQVETYEAGDEAGGYEDAPEYAEVETRTGFDREPYAGGAAHHGHQAHEEQEPYATYGDQTEEPAEGYGEPEDLAEQIQKIIGDAHAFRRVRLYNKALDTLRAGFDVDPRSMDLHEVYRDVLIESGQTEEAVQEMLVIAGLYVDSLDGESAARALQDVLAFDPQNQRAIELLQELGYEIVDENEEVGAASDLEQDEFDQSPEQTPLPSYDLEEMRAADVSAQYADDRHVYRGRGSIPPEGHGALPSFPLEEPEARTRVPGQYELDQYEPNEYDPNGYDADPTAGATAPPHDAEAYAASTYAPGPPSVLPPPPAPPPLAISPSSAAAAHHDLEDALDEAEFFCSRGLFDDARAILVEQLGRYPNNPLLRERLAELDAQEEQRGSGAREKPREEQQQASQESGYDIGASLDALEGLDYGDVEPAEGYANDDQQVDVEEVFAKFKEGVAKQISVDDSESHYNLGIAYKEMMLVDDAIREFEVASRDPMRECVCRSMIGMIEIERGNLNEAIEAFLAGLNAAIKEPQQETMLCYEIGAAYEAKKLGKEALTYYQKCMRRDPNYRDVQERVRRLAKNEPKTPLRQAAVGADDEFDRAFDDLVSKA
ncbi:TPR domain protein [Labilithrix luteola]|uniref:TPR domain protein n=1 Tax=Labilithrix luteola TaxID=1391654 RepID=A0A0K1QE42_9BACT|nr:tetratricopeptide repeat protein [Labilithrix luteola]AKV04029.1 TPR domain protein [Labilithrix luteola]